LHIPQAPSSLPQGGKACKRRGFPAERETLCSPFQRPYFAPMNNRPKEVDQATRRRKRLAAALRENLKRRKAQIKDRAATNAEQDAGQPHDSAGIVDDK